MAFVAAIREAEKSLLLGRVRHNTTTSMNALRSGLVGSFGRKIWRDQLAELRWVDPKGSGE